MTETCQRKTPENGPEHWIKSIDTVPDGERRELFNLNAPAAIFANPRPLTVEVVEVVVYAAVAGSFQLSKGTNLADATPITPVYPLAANEAYVDPGFLLEQGQSLFITPSAGGTFVGHALWRYA